MIRIVWTATLLWVVALGPAEAQKIRNGGLTGIVETHRVEVPGNMGSAQVHLTPNKGAFVLTQFCSLRPTELAGSTLGAMVRIVNADENDLECQSFTPGVVFPPNEVLTCHSRTVHPDPHFCFIIGVQTSK